MKLRGLITVCFLLTCLLYNSNLIFAENNNSCDKLIQAIAIEDDWLNREAAKQS